MMETRLPAILLTIGWLQCFSVVWFPVAIETQPTGSNNAASRFNSSEFGSTTVALLSSSSSPSTPAAVTSAAVTTTSSSTQTSTAGNLGSVAATAASSSAAKSANKTTPASPAAGTEAQSTAPDRSITSFMPLCPPPNNLHLLCDATLDNATLTCDERTYVIKECLDKGIYNDSEWEQCILESNYCEQIYKLLTQRGLIQNQTVVTTTVKITTYQSTSGGSVDNVNTSGVTNATSSVTYTTIHNLTTSIIPTSLTSLSTSSPSNETNGSSSGLLTPQTAKSEEKMNLPLPYSYVYPIIGVGFVVIEIIILSFIFCCYNRKSSSNNILSRKKRRQSENSLVPEEEMIEVQTAKPTQALCTKPEVYDDEAVVKEDKNIYRSYLNFPFIDDESKENTPVRK